MRLGEEIIEHAELSEQAPGVRRDTLADASVFVATRLDDQRARDP